MSTKKKKKQVKKMSLNDFTKQAGGPRVKSLLPSAPGELPAGPGSGGGYGNRRGGRGGSRYGDREQSKADSSRAWRSNGPSSSRGSSSRSFGGSFGGNRDRDSGSSYNNRDSGDRGSRYGSTRDTESKYNDNEKVGRSMFGSKKQATRIMNPSRDSSSFGSGRTTSSRNRDDNLSIDRSGFGKRKPLRPSGSSNFGGRSSNFEPSSGGYGTSNRVLKRGFFDGSGSGFGAHLVADLFNPDSSGSSDGPDRRVNYNFDAPKKTGGSRFSRADGEPLAPQPARDRAAPWGKATSATNAKTPEQIAEEEQLKTERENEARAERSSREAKQRTKKEKREAEEHRQAVEKAAREKEEAHLAQLREDIDTMLEGEARPLTREHLEVIMPQINPDGDEAVVLGTALAMTVNQETIPLKEAIHMIPETNFDTTLINMLSSLATRMGELNFISEIQSQSIDVFELMQDKTRLEKRLVDANLKCLVGNDETESQLDETFAKHVSLKELYEVVVAIEDFPAEMIPKVTSYVFQEFFSNKNVEDPAAWFDSGDIFEFLGEKLNGHTEIIDAGVRAWHEHGGARADILVPFFDRLLRADYIYADQVSIWSADYENHPAKMEAMMAEIDEDEQTFSEWLMDVETEYAYEEEDEMDEDGASFV